MRINVKKYDYLRINDKLIRVEVKQHWLYKIFANIILFFFKQINYKHVYTKYKYIKEMLTIRGLRTCSYEDVYGQIHIAQFMWKFGKYYI